MTLSTLWRGSLKSRRVPLGALIIVVTLIGYPQQPRDAGGRVGYRCASPTPRIASAIAMSKLGFWRNRMAS
jgi:hypothetical protein